MITSLENPPTPINADEMIPDFFLIKGIFGLIIFSFLVSYLKRVERVCSENSCPSKARKPAELEIELVTIVWTKPIMDGQADSISAICSAGCSRAKLVLRINNWLF